MGENGKVDKSADAPEMPEIETRSKKEGGLRFRDWWTVLLSTMAFVVSAAGFYVNNLQQTDDLRLIVNQLPRVHLDEDDYPSIDGHMRLGFINSGNQAAGIMKVYVSIHRVPLPTIADGSNESLQRLFPTRGQVKKTCDVISDLYTTDLPAFAIKPGDIAVKEIEITPALSLSSQKQMTKFPREGTFLSRSGLMFAKLAMCIDIAFATPSIGFTKQTVSFAVGGALDRSTFPFELTSEGEAHRGEIPKPFILRHESENAFQTWFTRFIAIGSRLADAE